MKVLVTGGTGLLGWWLARTLAWRGIDVFATYHVRKPKEIDHVHWIPISLENVDSLTETFHQVRPDVVIHSAAYTNVDGCEVNMQLAYEVNYKGTLAVARLAERFKAYMVYISTDYVFDGSRGLYKESDPPYPVNYYGLTKLLGEVVVSSILDASGLIIRVSGLYGYSPTGKRNFGIIALERLLNGEKVYAFKDQYLSPTYVPFLAEKITQLIERRRDVAGSLHLAGERMSRYEFARLLSELAGLSMDLVVPSSIRNVEFKAKRPRDSSLDTTKAKRMGLGLPAQEEGIRDFIETYKSMKVA